MGSEGRGVLCGVGLFELTLEGRVGPGRFQLDELAEASSTLRTRFQAHLLLLWGGVCTDPASSSR